MKILLILLLFTVLGSDPGALSPPPETAAPPEATVAYPEGYRNWSHVKSTLVSPAHAQYANIGGFQHIYANSEAMAGYRSPGPRAFPEGAVIVFDWLQMTDQNGAFQEGPRRQTDVMVRDSKRFAASGGWGFERFVGDSHSERSTKLTPPQCLACHERLRKDGLVLSSYRE